MPIQDFQVPSVQTLLEQLVTKEPLELLLEELKNQGISVLKMEEVHLGHDPIYWGSVRGVKVTLSDGRVFIPKLIEKKTSPSGVEHTFQYFLLDETPMVREYKNGVEITPNNMPTLK